MFIKPSKLNHSSDLLVLQSTRKGGVSDGHYASLNIGLSTDDQEQNIRKNRQLLFDAIAINESDIAKPVQTHSANITRVERAGIFDDCDALITNQKGIFLSIQTADCLPILLWDNKSTIAAVHAGWRGTEQQIIRQTIETMVEEYDVDVSQVSVFIGAGISQNYFEVGNEFEAKFDKKYLKRKNGKLFMDNVIANYDQITDMGVQEHKIEMTNYCSYRDRELFYSHRRDNGITGRNIALIGWRK